MAALTTSSTVVEIHSVKVAWSATVCSESVIITVKSVFDIFKMVLYVRLEFVISCFVLLLLSYFLLTISC